MKFKKILSLLMALAMVVSAAAFASAESTAPIAEEAEATDDGTASADVTYTADEMMTMAMEDTYARQAAYAAYAEAFPDSRSIGNIDLDTQIVLLEMLLKANQVALPETTANVTAPETIAEAYQAIATAEADTLTMYKSFLLDETLPADARLIFRSVTQSVRSTAITFAQRVRSANLQAQWQAAQDEIQQMIENGSGKTYVLNSPNGRGQWTVYYYSSDSDNETEAEAAEINEATETDEVTETDEPTETAEPAAEESVSN